MCCLKNVVIFFQTILSFMLNISFFYSLIRSQNVEAALDGHKLQVFLFDLG